MMKLLIAPLLIGATLVSSVNVRGSAPSEDVAPSTSSKVHQVDGMPPIPPTTSETEKYLVPEPVRVTMLYSSMNTQYADLMAKQVLPLLGSPCGHAVHWDLVPFGQTVRTPHPWVNTEYVYDSPKGPIDLMQNLQQLCTLDVFNNTVAGVEKASCLQAMASQDGEDKRGVEWFESGDNMKTCFGEQNLNEFKQILDCVEDARAQLILDNAVFKTYHLGLKFDDLPKVLINYKPIEFVNAEEDLRAQICKMDVNGGPPACCDPEFRKEQQDDKYFKLMQEYTEWAQGAVRQAQTEGKTDFDLRKIPQSVLDQWPKEFQDAIKAEGQNDKPITDDDLARARGEKKDVAQTE